ncbi:MAG: serine/threonine protein kinase [Polyangiaceae bacterium]|nr:serine/threonine protein kinase [Polyangiaceae bacterium]
MAGPRFIDAGYRGPRKIDRYRLVSEIASGGMATVFLASLGGVGGFQRLVAIKRLHQHLENEEQFVQMFLDEARLVARIHHPNVVAIQEVGASQAGYYLVMEYVEGDTLSKLLGRTWGKSSGMPAPIALRIMVDVLEGLHAAHELKDEEGALVQLVHRDVSPQNILIGMDGVARIADFGVARASTRLNSTKSGQLKGKMAYMAPEQARAEPGLDRRADVFAAGIVLWEALSGKRLFRRETEAETLSTVLSLEIPHICDVNPKISRPLGDAVMGSLQRGAAERYATCSAFGVAIEKSCGLQEVATTKEVAAFVQNLFGDEVKAFQAQVQARLRSPEIEPAIDAANGDDATASIPPEVSSVRTHGSTTPAGTAAPIAAAELSQPSGPAGISARPLLMAGGIAALTVLLGSAILFSGDDKGKAPATASPVTTEATAPIDLDSLPSADGVTAEPTQTLSVESLDKLPLVVLDEPAPAVRQRPTQRPTQRPASRRSTRKLKPEPKAKKSSSPAKVILRADPPKRKPKKKLDLDLSNPYR